MGFNCGIVGLPNVGKSTLFNALTNSKVDAANYPFCTINPNVGVVAVPDERLDAIFKILKPQNKIPTTIEFVDIAGLVKGASQGEGLGNQFLGHIRKCDALAHVVRCFENSDVVHVCGNCDPVRDIQIINTELILADLDTIKNRQEKNSKLLKVGQKQGEIQNKILVKIENTLNQGLFASACALTAEEQTLIADIALITQKPMFYVCNVQDMTDPASQNFCQQVALTAANESRQVVTICGQLESEMSELSCEEKQTFLKDYGLSESGLNTLARAGYQALKLVTFFTHNDKEVRAWTVTEGTKAPQAAGKIHSDIEKGFIRAEVTKTNDWLKYGSEVKIREMGQLKVEGKEYVVADGDIIYFRF